MRYLAHCVMDYRCDHELKTTCEKYDQKLTQAKEVPHRIKFNNNVSMSHAERELDSIYSL